MQYDRQYYRDRGLDQPSVYHESLARLIHKELPTASVLDLGCGYGFRAAMLKKFGHYVVAVDSSETVASSHVVTADALEWLSMNYRERFDVVIMWQFPQLLTHDYFNRLLSRLRSPDSLITHLSGDSPVEGKLDDYLRIIENHGFLRVDEDLRRRYSPFKFMLYRKSHLPADLQLEVVTHALKQIKSIARQVANWDYYIGLPVGEREAVKCDVVIPYHEANFPWLATSIDSILNQNYAECVIHLIADGFDSPQDPVLHYQNHSQVRWYRNETQIGPYRSLHRIFDRLETDFVAIQDSDDIALPNRIWLSVRALTERGADVVSATMEQFVSHERRTASISEILAGSPYLSSGHGRWRGCPSGNLINPVLAFRKCAFEGINGFSDISVCADNEFAERLQRAHLAVVILPNILGLRRLHYTSYSHSPDADGKSKELREGWLKLDRNVTEFDRADFDPRRYGVLDRDRLDARQTVRLNGG